MRAGSEQDMEEPGVVLLVMYLCEGPILAPSSGFQSRRLKQSNKLIYA